LNTNKSAESAECSERYCFRNIVLSALYQVQEFPTLMQNLPYYTICWRDYWNDSQNLL